MSDRGSCKVFSPNIFNPTKCQNCYKPKEGHPSGSVNQTGSKMQRGVSLPVVRERVRTLLGYILVLCLSCYRMPCTKLVRFSAAVTHTSLYNLLPSNRLALC